MEPEIETLKLKIEKIVAQQILTTELIGDNLSMNAHLDVMFAQDNIAIREIYHLATLEEPIAKYPADWWQAFKVRWFPQWLLKRHPAQYTEIVARHKFPQYPVSKLGHEYVDIRLIKPGYFQE